MSFSHSLRSAGRSFSLQNDTRHCRRNVRNVRIRPPIHDSPLACPTNLFKCNRAGRFSWQLAQCFLRGQHFALKTICVQPLK